MPDFLRLFKKQFRMFHLFRESYNDLLHKQLLDNFNYFDPFISKSVLKRCCVESNAGV